MPLPLAPLVPLVLRLGVVAAAGYAIRRLVTARAHPGRTDIRAEDALDDLGEGVALHRPLDLAPNRQTNTTMRLRRIIRFRGKTYEVDAGLIARLRIRRAGE
ncbi:MAG: hypothetical protein V4516_11570 [Pseudomonadota bacterium]